MLCPPASTAQSVPGQSLVRGDGTVVTGRSIVRAGGRALGTPKPCVWALQELSASSSSSTPDGRAGSARPPGPGTRGRPATAQRCSLHDWWSGPDSIARRCTRRRTNRKSRTRSDRPWALRVTRRSSCSRCFWWARARRDGSTESPRATTGAKHLPQSCHRQLLRCHVARPPAAHGRRLAGQLLGGCRTEPNPDPARAPASALSPMAQVARLAPWGINNAPPPARLTDTTVCTPRPQGTGRSPGPRAGPASRRPACRVSR